MPPSFPYRPFFCDHGAALRGHHVTTAAEMGWQKLRNGKLLLAAADTFDVLLAR